jgi:acyl-coenzyme A thioesterase PaaI-like protein
MHVCETSVLRPGNHIAATQLELEDDEGELIATGGTAFVIG